MKITKRELQSSRIEMRKQRQRERRWMIDDDNWNWTTKRGFLSCRVMTMYLDLSINMCQTLIRRNRVSFLDLFSLLSFSKGPHHLFLQLGKLGPELNSACAPMTWSIKRVRAPRDQTLGDGDLSGLAFKCRALYGGLVGWTQKPWLLGPYFLIIIL